MFSFSRLRIVFFLLAPAFSFAQNSQIPVQDVIINSYAVDSINNIIYAGGEWPTLFAQDVLTGNIITSWSPSLSSATLSPSNVKSIVAGNDTIYIAGNFDKVEMTPRLNFVALNRNENILSWNPGAILNQNITVYDMIKDGNYIYVGCDLGNNYGSGILIINARTGNIINDSTGINSVDHYVYKLKMRNDTLYALTEVGLSIYLKSDLQLIRESTDLWNYGYILNGAPASDFTLYGNRAFFSGDYMISSQRYAILAYDISTLTRITNWDQPLFGTCPFHTYLDLPPAITQPLISSIIMRDTTMFIGGYDIRDRGTHLCSDIFSIMTASPNATNSLGIFTNNIFFGTVRYNVSQFKIVGNLLYSVSSYNKYDNASGTYFRNDAITTHCLIPHMPDAFNISTSPICPKSKNIKYGIPKTPLTTYNWTYSGTGVTINTQGNNSTDLSFANNPTPGILSVTATSVCGLTSVPQTFQINILPEPNAKAGIDQQIDCRKSTVSLTGTSDTADVTWQWKWPKGHLSDNFEFATDSIGEYVLTITKSSTGCYKTDTVRVIKNITKPIPLVITSSPYIINCYGSPIIYGASNNVGDTLKWNSYNKLYGNPMQPVDSGKYVLTVIGYNNGCNDTVSIHVSEKRILPPYSVVTPSPLLTCKDTTAFLKAKAVDSLNTLIFWTHKTDTLMNPALVDSFGLYQVIVMDINNGCVSSSAVFVNSNFQVPQINPSSSHYITCSNSSTLLKDTSITPNAVLNWTGANNFSSTNPAVVFAQGTYTLTIKNTVNGCVASKIDSVILKPWLTLNSSADTTVCYGSSALLNSSPVGGTSPFIYEWKSATNILGNASQQSVTPGNSINKYAINISDDAGCTGSDTVIVERVTELRDSTISIQPCDPQNATGQIQVFAYGSVAPYLYSINSNPFDTLPIFPNLSLGLYNISIKDALGCTLNTQAEINTTSQLPIPNFLVATNTMMGDTIVMVDISNPKPDKIQWTFPAGAAVIDSNFLAPVIVCPNTGDFTIIMKANFGSCEMIISKTIHIKPYDSTFATSKNKNGIEDVSLSPNPNDGNFTVDVKLFKKQAFVVMIVNSAGVEQFKQTFIDSDQYNNTFSLSGNGTYILKIISEYDSAQRTFIVTK